MVRSVRTRTGSFQVTPRLLWHLQNNYRLKEAVEKNNAQFGTLDTWLIYKLTGGKLHATDPSNASCTGFFDPFTMSWATWAFHVLHIPPKILPEVMDTADDFGFTFPDLFGAAIPIRSCASICPPPHLPAAGLRIRGLTSSCSLRWLISRLHSSAAVPFRAETLKSLSEPAVSSTSTQGTAPTRLYQVRSNDSEQPSLSSAPSSSWQLFPVYSL